MKYFLGLVFLFCTSNLILGQQGKSLPFSNQTERTGLNSYSNFYLHHELLSNFSVNANKIWKDVWRQQIRLDSVVLFTMGKPNSTVKRKSMISYEYDEQTLNSISTYHIWKEFSNFWEAYSQTILEYDHDHKLISRTIMIWDEEYLLFEPVYYYEYHYQEDQLSEIIISFRDLSTVWHKQYKDVFLYDSNKVLQQQIRYEFRENHSFWLGISKWKFLYNPSGTLDRSIRQDINVEIQDWDNKEEYKYNYDEFENPREIYVYKWSESPPLWREESKYFLTFDNNIYRDQLMLPYSFIESTHKLLRNEFLIFDIETEDFELSEFEVFYYNDDINSTKALTQKEINVTPNPAINTISIDIPDQHCSIQIYDENGKLVIDNKLKSTHSIDISNLQTGIFFIKLLLSEKILTGKFIKIH